MPKVRGRVLKGEGEGIEGGGEYGRGIREGTGEMDVYSTNMDVCCLFAVSLLPRCCLVAVLSSSLLFFKQPETAHHRRLWDGECVEIEV